MRKLIAALIKFFLPLLFIVYFFLLVLNINSIYLFVGDEKRYSESVLALLDGYVDTNNHPLLAKTIWLAFVSASYTLFGVDKAIFWRLGTIILSLATLFVFYKILRIFFPKTLAIAACVFLALDPMYFVFSRLVQLDVPALFFSLSSLYFFIIYLKAKDKSVKYFLFAALFLGLSLSVKFSALLVSFLAPFVVLAPYIKRLDVKNLLIKTGLYFIFLILGFSLGNFMFLIYNPSLLEFFWYTVSLINSQLTMPPLAENFQVSPAGSWFLIPQILTMYRLNWGKTVESIIVFQNPFFFLVSFLASIGTVFLVIRKKIKESSEFGFILFFGSFQYIPWLIRLHSTYYYYIIPLLPLIILLFLKLVSMTKYTKQIVSFTLVVTLFIFFLYFPLLVGLRVPKSYELFLYNYSRYKYSDFNTLFCQNCYPRK